MPLVPLQNVGKLEQPTTESLRGFKDGKSVIIAKGCGVVDGGRRKKTRLF